jgi:hypothetical protein
MNLNLSERDVVFLESKGVHCPWNALCVVKQAIRAKRKDFWASRTGRPFEPCLTKALSELAGVCQKVVLNEDNRNKFKQLYQSAFLQGKFKRH